MLSKYRARRQQFQNLGRAAAPARTARSDPPERAIGRRWLTAAATALVAAYVAQTVVPAAETSPAPIAGIAPSYGPKTVSAVPNAAAIVQRIWLPELDARWDLAWHLRRWSRPALPLHGTNLGPTVRRRDTRGVPSGNGADYPRPRPGRGDRRGAAVDRAQRLELGHHRAARPCYRRAGA